MKNRWIIFSILLVCCQNKKDNNIDKSFKYQHTYEIEEAFEEVKIDENWQKINFYDDDFLFCPIKWKKNNNNKDFTYSLKTNDEIEFYIDIKENGFKRVSDFENYLINSIDNFNIKNKYILKVSYKNSSDIKYFIESDEKNFKDFTNIFLSQKLIYRFGFISEKKFSDKYLDTLEIITNTYMVKKNERLVPVLNGVSKVDLIKTR